MQTTGESVIEIRTVVIDQQNHGQRLDNFLFTFLKKCPKSRIYRAIRSGEIRINGKRCRPLQKLQLNDSVRVPMFAAQAAAPVLVDHLPEMIDKAILFEDEELLLLNKPPFFAVHSGEADPVGLIDLMGAYRPYHGVIDLAHRLDKATTGVLVFSKTRFSNVALKSQFRDRLVKKQYLALVLGHVWQDSGRMEHLLYPTVVSGQHKMAAGQEGKQAITEFEVVQRYQSPKQLLSKMVEHYTLMRLRPKTGRKHQLRIQLKEFGHPIINDPKYYLPKFNNYSACKEFSFFLHASQVELMHPKTKKVLTVKAPLTKEQEKCLNYLDPIN